MSNKAKFKTSIGGQALIEGVMMRGPEKSAMAVRLPDGTIDVEKWDTASMKKWYRKTPFVRGMFNMVDSLAVGYRCLMRSAAKSGMDDEPPPAWLDKITGGDVKKANDIVGAFSMVVGVAIALGLFMMLPSFLVGFLRPVLATAMLRSIAEGIVKIGIFVLYIALVSRIPEIRRVFAYHGAEHKAIACYEAKLPLTVENVRRHSPFHPRCGTSFLLIVMVVSILIFSVVTWNNVFIRVVLKLASLPLVVGIAYEIIKYAGRHDNPLTRFISAPGLWLQRLTTNAPDDAQIEVAIAAMEPTIPENKGQDDAW